MSDFMADYMQSIEKSKQEAKATLCALIPQLKAAGIAYVVAYYDGCGDSGQIECVCFFGPGVDKESVDTTRALGDIDSPTIDGVLLTDPNDNQKGVDLDRPFDQLCPSGYENNDGGFGAIILDVEATKIRVNSAARFTDYSTDDYEV